MDKVNATETSSPSQLPSKIIARGSDSQARPTWQGFFDEYMALVNSSASNVEKIIAATILLEKMIDTFVAAFEPEPGPRGYCLTFGHVVDSDVLGSHQLSDLGSCGVQLYRARTRLLSTGGWDMCCGT
jgi:hypothetical protein